MAQVFLRQDEARAYVAGIDDPVDKLLVEAAFSRMVGFLVSDADYGVKFSESPFDLLLFVRGIHALFRNKEVLRKILDGTYRSIDDIVEAF